MVKETLHWTFGIISTRTVGANADLIGEGGVVKPIRLTANRSRRQRGEPEPRDHQVALAAVGPSATLRPELFDLQPAGAARRLDRPPALWAVELGALQQGRQRHAPAGGHCSHAEGPLRRARTPGKP